MRLLLAALVGIALALAGCGGDDRGGGEEGGGEIDLRVTVYPNGVAGDSTMWTLQCDPVGGDHPDRDAACARLAALDDPFGKVKHVPRCDEIPGATPEVALIEGDFHGRMVEERFDRSSGCVFERWDRLGPVFPTGF
ncbi:MAG: SSI family serine proteinase inhibitor [Gaiellaceae bacterium]